MKKTISFILALTLVFGIIPTLALAANETDLAATYLVENGIFVGDQNGNLNLDQGLTRAELAVILTRLDFMDAPGGLAEWDAWGDSTFRNPDTRLNPFTDIPDWALPFIEYCYQRRLMVGVSDNKFDPQGKVNPKMACTVILRYCAIPETDWDYQTSVEKAQSIGIAPVDGTSGDTLLRGTMAVIIYRGIQYSQSGTIQPGTTDPATSVPPQVTPPTTSESTMTIEEMKAEIVRLTNIERVKAGVPELEVLPELMDCAQAKADDFKANNYFGHISPIYGTPGEMIKSYVPNAKSAGENSTSWTKTPQEAFDAFLSSPEHYQNMIAEKYTHIGIGIVEGVDGGYWWVQQFVTLP